MQKSISLAAIAASALLACAAAHGQVLVDKPWVRTTVAQQTTTAAYMTITAVQGGTLVAASSPIATSVEVHVMKMDGDMMKMRAVDALALPAGQPVALRSGGYHMMLMGLKAPLKTGVVVPIRLVVEDRKGRRESVDVKAVASLTP